MKKHSILIILSLFSGIIDGREKQINFKIEQNENGYSYSCHFQSTLSRDSVLAILFGFDHLVKYSSQVSQIELLSEEKNSYLVSFYLRYLIYSSRSVYRRTLLKEKDMVVIEMLRFNHNSTVFPQVLGIRIEYRVVPRRNGVNIYYKQKCLFNRPINWLYLKIVEGKLNESMRELQRYISSRS
ncbi:MAG: hypothetical protein GX267_18630 [Fibrobacter sp.]|jgi:hypothetical protein|nr:hypothetical protein [Fibrobacter sp.]